MKTKASYARSLVILIFLFCIMNNVKSIQSDGWKNYVSYGEYVYDACFSGSNLWLGTHCGVVRFDTLTKEFSYFTKAEYDLPGNEIISICPYPGNKVAIGDRFGVGIFDGSVCDIYNKTNSPMIYEYNISSLAYYKEKLYVASVLRLHILHQETWNTIFYGTPAMSDPDYIFDIKPGIDDSMFVLKSEGIYQVSGDNLTPYFTGLSTIKDFVFIGDTLWMAATNGLYKYQGGMLQRYDSTNSSLPDSAFWDIDLDSRKNIWLINDKGLTKVDCNTLASKTINNENIPLGYKSLLIVDSHDNLWIIEKNGKKIWRYDGATWQDWSFKSELPSNSFYNFVLDSSDRPWLSTTKDIGMFNRVETVDVDSADINKFESVRTLYQDGKRKIILFEKDSIVVDFSGKADKIKLGRIGYTNKVSPDIAYDPEKKVFWKATSKGLERYAGGVFDTIDIKTPENPTNDITRLYLEKDGSLLISTRPKTYIEYGSLIKYDGASMSTICICGISHWVAGVTRDLENNLWLGVMDREYASIEYGGGLHKIDSGKLTSYYIGNSGLPSNSVVDLACDSKGNILIGTYGGGMALFDYHNSKPTMVDTTIYYGKEGWTVYEPYNSAIPGLNVESVVTDSADNIWAYTQGLGLTYIPHSAYSTNNLPQVSNSISSQKLVLFPLPCNDVLNIRLNTFSDKIAIFSIYDLTGKMVFQKFMEIPENNIVTLPVSGQVKGGYILKVTGKTDSACKLFLVR